MTRPPWTLFPRKPQTPFSAIAQAPTDASASPFFDAFSDKEGYPWIAERWLHRRMTVKRQGGPGRQFIFIDLAITSLAWGIRTQGHGMLFPVDIPEGNHQTGYQPRLCLAEVQVQGLARMVNRMVAALRTTSGAMADLMSCA